MNEFELEDRYVVFKRKDIEEYMVDIQKDELSVFSAAMDLARRNKGKPTLKCVVIESGWPEYQVVCDMLEKRVNYQAEYEYEKVEGLKAWEIMKLHEEGAQLYTGEYEELRIDEIKNIGALVVAMEAGSLYTRKEKPWWEGCEGVPVMVSFNGVKWLIDIFMDAGESNHLPFVCRGGSYQYARPLTAAERDAIKVRG